MGQLTFYFDRNVGTRLPAALNGLRPPFRVAWHQNQGFAADLPDDEWMHIVGPRQWVVVSQDRKFHKMENELAAVRQHSLRCFYLPCASDGTWATLCNIIRAHERMMEIARSQPAPFIYDLRRNGRLYRVPI